MKYNVRKLWRYFEIINIVHFPNEGTFNLHVDYGTYSAQLFLVGKISTTQKYQSANYPLLFI